ncbi:hypothetical protein [Actinoplanes sp. NPDC049802]|uniref:hypothetical protein n=1 Tax=Actinoplanes sp. NPDC049802 TaxID=3154742 RepID=UPI0033E2D795
MRGRRTRIAIAAAIALATSGSLAGCFRSAPEQPVKPLCPIAAPPSQQLGAETAGVRVVETGFTRVGGFGTAKVSMGALIRNDSDKVAYRTLVTFDAVDAAGRSVIHDDHRLFRTQLVPVISPGDTLPVGSASLLDEAAQSRESQIASINVTAHVIQWLDPNPRAEGLAKVTAEVVAGSGKRDDSGKGEITYDFESPSCAPMTSRGVSMVFHSESGDILGGSLASPTSWLTCEPGINSGKREIISQSDIPAGADLDRTSITVYCDFDRAQPSLASGSPYN